MHIRSRCVHTRVCMTDMHILCVYAHAYVNVDTCVHEYICVWYMYVCMCVPVSVCICVCASVYILCLCNTYICVLCMFCVHVCLHVYVCIYVCIEDCRPGTMPGRNMFKQTSVASWVSP